MPRGSTREPNPHPLRVFLCHASEDILEVRKLFYSLRADGIEPWLSDKVLLAGQDWDEQIRVAMNESDAVVICLSQESVRKEGVFQREIRIALDINLEKLEGAIFIIPTRLSQCDIPRNLSRFHWVNLFEKQGYKRLLRSLENRRQQVVRAEKRFQQRKEKGGPHLELSHNAGRRLANIVEATGMDQKEIAELANVSEPWLSQVITGNLTSLNEDSLERLARVLVASLKNRPTDDSLPKEDVLAALTSWGRYTETPAVLVSPKHYRPGGPVPVDAIHYVGRTDDSEALEALQELPFTMLVRGPVQCGKSSLLARLEHDALEQGIETAWFNPEPQTPTKSAKNEPHISAPAIALGELLQVEWGLAPSSEGATDSIAKLFNWLSKSLAPSASKHRLLIFDDLSNLGAIAVEEWLSSFVRGMHNKRARGGPQVSIAVGLTLHYAPSFGHRLLDVSSVVHWWPRIELGWFEDWQVQELERAVGGGSAKGDLLYPLFAGQPYLTHTAAADSAFAQAVHSWVDAPSEGRAQTVRATQTYKRHLNALKLAILGPTLEFDAETRDLLHSLVQACSGHKPSHQDHKLFLETAKLLNEAGQPALAIYRLMAEDLSELSRR